MAGEVQQGGAHDRARIVRRYLSALDAQKPGRSQARTQETLAHRMHQVDTLLLSADPVQRLHLTQERIDLHAEHLRLQSASNDFAELEKAFIRVARSYGERHDITFSAWRQVGVDAGVLARASITAPGRANRPSPAPAASEQQPAKYKPAAKNDEPKPAPAAKAEAPAPKAEAPAPKKQQPAAKAAPAPAPKAEAPAAKKQQPAAKKQQPAAKKQPVAKKAPAAKKAAQEPKPEQQQLPAEVRLLG